MVGVCSALRSAPPRVVDEDAAHRLRRRRDEMRPVLPLHAFVVGATTVALRREYDVMRASRAAHGSELELNGELGRPRGLPVLATERAVRVVCEVGTPDLVRP